MGWLDYKNLAILNESHPWDGFFVHLGQATIFITVYFLVFFVSLAVILFDAHEKQ